jgi:hypothetical protein
MKKSEEAEAMFVDFNYWKNSAALNAQGARYARNNGTQAFDSKKNHQTSPCPPLAGRIDGQTIMQAGSLC